MDFLTSYDEVYGLLTDEACNELVQELCRALVRIDRARAGADFVRLWKSSDPTMQAIGAEGFDALKPLSEALQQELLHGVDLHDPLAVAKLPYAILDTRPDLLLVLLDHPDKGTANTALMLLRNLSLDRSLVMSGWWSPAGEKDPVGLCRQWWAEHKSESAEARQAAGLKAYLADIRPGAKWTDFGWGVELFKDRPEAVAAFARWLPLAEGQEQQDVLTVMLKFTGPAQEPARRAIEEFMLTASADYVVTHLGLLARSRDPRVARLMLGLFETNPEALGFYSSATPEDYSISLGPEVDRRAAEICFRRIVEKGDENAAGWLAYIPGGGDYLPRLTDAWATETDPKKSAADRKALAEVGDSRLGPELVRLLGFAHAGSSFEEDILQLMAYFPDEAAAPFLRRMLAGGDPRRHVYAASILARLGDTSGAAALVEGRCVCG